MRVTEEKTTSDLTVIKSKEYLYRVALPAADSEAHIIVRCVDWNRIKRRLGKCRSNPKFLTIIYSAFYGVAGSAALSALGVWEIKDQEWLKTTYIVVAIAGVCLGVVLQRVERMVLRRNEEDVSEILGEMEDLQSRFPGLPPSGLPAPGSDSA